jgi:Flp pilus assembly protein TadG
MMNRIGRRRNRIHSRRGATIVEASLVLSIALMFLFGLFDFGRVLMFRQLLANAAREGARLATVSTNSLTTSDIQTCVTNYLAGQQLKNVIISVYEADPTTGNNIGTWNSAALSNCIAVEVTATYSCMTPTFSMMPSNLPMSAKVVMNSEGN